MEVKLFFNNYHISQKTVASNLEDKVCEIRSVVI